MSDLDSSGYEGVGDNSFSNSDNHHKKRTTQTSKELEHNQPSFHRPVTSPFHNSEGSSIDLKTIQQWATGENLGRTVLAVFTNLTSLKLVMCREKLPVDWIHYLSLSLQKVIQDTTHTAQVRSIMEVAAHSNFVDRHIPGFLQRVNENTSILSSMVLSMRAFQDILDYMVMRFTDCQNKIYVCACKIEETGKRYGIFTEGNEMSNRCSQLKAKSCPIPLIEGAHNFRPNQGRFRREKDIISQDHEIPPDDFTQKSIFPDMDELNADAAVFLRANKTSGPYRNVQHYTDVHFRLLREDYLGPLRDGLRAYRQSSAENPEVKSHLRFYYNVQIGKMLNTDNDGICFIVIFNPKDLQEDIQWEYSKRFLHGSLLAFSKDNFNTIMFATVINRDAEQLEKGHVEVCFQSNLDLVLTSSEKDTFVIAETVSLFEAYKHVLEGLQEVSELPLDDYILYCKPSPNPPEYLTNTVSYDIGCIMEDGEDRELQILDPAAWPDHDNTVLNASQLEAVKLALTNELAIIQGPPGTGKTYVGLHIMELLLKNQARFQTKTRSPILVVCYTNHALDQFLEGILDFCEGGIVRVGRRSKSEKLGEFNLTRLRTNPNMDKRLKRTITNDLKESNKRLKEVSHFIKGCWQESLNLDTCIQSTNDLKDEITQEQLLSLTDPSRVGSDGNEMNVWLKASNADIETHLIKAAEKHLIKLILKDEGETMDDELLVKGAELNFKQRMKIYRGWLVHYRHYNEAKNADNIENDILPDEEICPYMSSKKVFDKIKLCVERECKLFKPSMIIRSWLLGYFQNVDQLFKQIECMSSEQEEHMSDTKTRPGQRNIMNYHRVIEDRVVIDNDNEGDDDRMRGFYDDENDDQTEDETSSNSSETSKLIDDFKGLVINFKEAEKREVTLLQRAKMLQIDMSKEEGEDEKSAQGLLIPNQMNYSEVFRLIDRAKLLSQKEANEITDVWSLPLQKRYSLYKFWILSKKKKIAEEIIQLTDVYNEFLKMKKKALSKKDIAILKQGQVIGMTTTRAAQCRAVLQQVKPEIIIVEEAAEVLEAHIVTTLNQHCKHLILIGDHQQLRPNPTVHKLAIDYDLEISLFERLIKNSVKHVTLQIQHRMRPEISRYIMNIYPRLRNHDSVSFYENVKGVGSNIYFIVHKHRETDILETRSKANAYEAEYLTNFCKYLLQQGYSGNQITILAAYNGQVSNLKEFMKPEQDVYNQVRVTSIDNYQGEENDIVLVSLVRSNLKQEVGFLKVNNRICVALSRAKIGLFVIGNLDQLSGSSKLWQKILDQARKHNQVGVNLKLVCRNHPHHETFIRHGNDFGFKTPEGGCDKICGASLHCGHTCPRMCHISDPDHNETFCQEPCRNVCDRGHPCLKRCHQDCGNCETLVTKEIPHCGHKDHVPCYLDVFDASCGQVCKQLLPCGHICKGICGQCHDAGRHLDCEEKVEKTWSFCGHKSTVSCCTDVVVSPCPAKCRERLKCGDFCRGTCGECLTKRVHKPCQASCKKALPCGHQCQSKCSVPCEPCKLRCPTMCLHGTCAKSTCGDNCDVCKENCLFVCKHRQCSERCGDECTSKPCNQRCNKLMECKHRCTSICGERCVCFKCDEKDFGLIDFGKSKPGKTVLADAQRASKISIDKDEILMKVPRCGHVFTKTQLDKFVKEFEPDGTSYIRCPRCEKTIQGIIRYDSLNKSRAHRRENRKHELQKYNAVAEADIEKLEDSLDVISNICPFDLSHFQRHQNQAIQRCHADALRLLSRFAFILHTICNIHQEFNDSVPFNAEKWKAAIRSNQLRITPQFEEEMTMELHRLLISEQLVACKSLVDEAGINLDDSLKTQYKNLTKNLRMHQLNQEIKHESEQMVSGLFNLLHSSQMAYALRQNSEKLASRVTLAKSVLDEPRNVYLHTILEEKGSLPLLSDLTESVGEESPEEDFTESSNE